MSVQRANGRAAPHWVSPRPHLFHDAQDDGVDEADGGHAHQAQEEEVGVVVQLEVRGLGVEDGAHQLALGRAEPWDDSEGGVNRRMWRIVTAGVEMVVFVGEGDLIFNVCHTYV